MIFLLMGIECNLCFVYYGICNEHELCAGVLRDLGVRPPIKAAPLL